jgi:hypothetical protein
MQQSELDKLAKSVMNAIGEQAMQHSGEGLVYSYGQVERGVRAAIQSIGEQQSANEMCEHCRTATPHTFNSEMCRCGEREAERSGR